MLSPHSDESPHMEDAAMPVRFSPPPRSAPQKAIGNAPEPVSTMRAEGPGEGAASAAQAPVGTALALRNRMPVAARFDRIALRAYLPRISRCRSHEVPIIRCSLALQ
jgi:hypothetical protein